MVGNGVVNWTYDCTPATLNMTYSHALYNDELHDKIVKEQCDYSQIEFEPPKNPSNTCMSYLDEFYNETGLGTIVDIDNIFTPFYGYVFS